MSSITPIEIKNLVKDEDDFGHEMRVGDIILNSSGDWSPHHPVELVDFRHGGTYTDPSTNKPRQFDFRCQIVSQDYAGPNVNQKCVFLAIECKNLHEQSPLVICGRKRLPDECQYDIIESNWDPHANSRLKIHRGTFLYPADSFVGKSTLRLKRDGKLQWRVDFDSDVYDKWSQAIQSAKDLIEKAFVMAETSQRQKVSSIVLPIMVVPDGLLWTVEYDEHGNISDDPKLADSCEYYVGRQIECKWHWEMNPRVVNLSHVHFTTLTGFAALLDRFRKKGNGWANWIDAFRAY